MEKSMKRESWTALVGPNQGRKGKRRGATHTTNFFSAFCSGGGIRRIGWGEPFNVTQHVTVKANVGGKLFCPLSFSPFSLR